MSASRAALEQAFRRTLYTVFLPDGELIVRIGVHDRDAERRIVAATACRAGWHIVTPCNPDAQQVSVAANTARLAAFHLELRGWGGAWQATLARAPGGDWPEEAGALIVDADDAWVRALAQQYRQQAYVSASLGRAPELAWLA